MNEASRKRKARTHHLVQLGGLIERAGLEELLGFDGYVNKDNPQWEAVHALNGLLLVARERLKAPDGEKFLRQITERGKADLQKKSR